MAQFLVAQTLGGVTTSDMDSASANAAFIEAVLETVALSNISVTGVAIVSVATPSDKTQSNRFRSATTSSVIVNYMVTYETYPDQLAEDYDALSVQISFYVETGTFQDFLQIAAMSQNPVPAALTTCTATQIPSVGGYTTITDDINDDIATTSDDSANNNNSSSKGLSQGAVAAISLSLIFIAAIVIACVYYNHKSKLTNQSTVGGAADKSTAAAGSADSAGHAGVELHSVYPSSSGETGHVHSPILAAAGYQRNPLQPAAVVAPPEGGVPLPGMVEAVNPVADDSSI
jgi:hypothetical protein